MTQRDLDDVIELLPASWTHQFSVFEGASPQDDEQSDTLALDHLQEITLDVGRRPQCWIDHKRFFLSDDESVIVNHDDIKSICHKIGEFGSDNRATMDGKLHRFSAMRDRKNQILGLTIRIGRNIIGNADMISPLC